MQPVVLPAVLVFSVFSIARLGGIVRRHLSLERDAEPKTRNRLLTASRIRLLGIGMGIAAAVPFGVGMNHGITWLRNVGVAVFSCGAVTMILGRVLMVLRSRRADGV